MAILALSCLVIAYRLPGFEAFNYLPLFSIVDNTRLKIVFTFWGSVLAGFGFDEMRQCIASRGRENRWVCHATAFAAGLALLVLVAIAFCKFFLFPLAARFHLEISPLLRYFLFSIFSFRELKTVIPAVAVLFAMGVCVWQWRKSLRPWFDWAIIAIVVVVELLVLAWGYNSMVKKGAVFPHTDLTNMLQQEGQPYRVMSTSMFWPNFGCVYGIAHIEGYDLPVFQRYAHLYRIQGGKGLDYMPEWSAHWPLVDWMNVKYIFTIEELPAPRFTPVLIYETVLLSGKPVKVYRNETVLPRAYMVYQAEVIPDDQVALRKLTDGTFDFKEHVILSNALPRMEMEQIQHALGNQQQSSVQFLTYTTDQVVLHVTTDSPSLLVMSDMYAPGWKARVDDAGAQVIRANYAFRAVFVPKGEHVVTFYYQPLSFQIGKILSVIGLGALVAGGLLSCMRKR